MFLENDLALGDGAGFIRAQHVHGAKILDGIQPLDDDLLLRHGNGALRQIDSHDHRQHFRGQTHGDCQGKQKGFQPVVLAQSVEDKHQRNHHQHESDHQPGETVHPAVEAGHGPLISGDAV